MVKYNAKLYIKWAVNESYCLEEYENVTEDKIAELSNYMEDIIYNHKAVDAQLEYTPMEG